MTKTEARIEWDSSTDRYNNTVSKIVLENGHWFRMVLHSKPYHASKRYTIYSGRNIFVKVRTFTPTNDCMETYCEIADYRVSWGDGDNGGVINNPFGPDLTAELSTIQDDNIDAVIITVLTAIRSRPDLWMSKPNWKTDTASGEHSEVSNGNS